MRNKLPVNTYDRYLILLESEITATVAQFVLGMCQGTSDLATIAGSESGTSIAF